MNYHIKCSKCQPLAALMPMSTQSRNRTTHVGLAIRYRRIRLALTADTMSNYDSVAIV